MGPSELVEVSDGRWLYDLGDGLGLEIVLLFSRTIAFWRLDGALVAEASVGDA